MLQNAYFLAKIGADTAENEQHFAEILPIGRRVADRVRRLQARVAEARDRDDEVLAEGPHTEGRERTLLFPVLIIN